MSSFYHETKQFKKQENILEKYLKTKDWSDYHVGLELIQLYKDRKKNNKALKALSQLRQAFPENKDLWFHQIILLVNMQKIKKALLEASEFSKAYPDDIKDQQLFVFIYLKSGRTEKAIETLSRLNKEHQDYDNVLWMVVNALLEKKDKKER